MRQHAFRIALLVLCTPSMLLCQTANQSELLTNTNHKAVESSTKSISSAIVPEPPQIDPDFARIITEQPPLRIQESIVYPDGSGTSWVICPLDPSGKTQVRWKGSPVRDISSPMSGIVFGTCYGQGALWSTVGSNTTNTLELFRYDLDLPINGWKKVGTFDGEGGIPSLIVPLKQDNQFLGISSQGLLEPTTRRASFVGIFHNAEEKLHLESCIELPFDDIPNIVQGKWIPIPNQKQEISSTAKEEDNINRFWIGYANPSILTLTLRLPSLSDDFLVLGAASAGALWIFDLETGRLRRTINITSTSSKDLSKMKPLKHVILGTGFTPEGRLIVAARDPDLIKMTVALDLDKPDSPEKNIRNEDFEFFNKEIKEIHWWQIDPKTGSQVHLDSPVDFPARMPSASRHLALRFLVNQFGYVKTNAFMPWPKVMEEFFTCNPMQPNSDKTENNENKNQKTTNK